MAWTTPVTWVTSQVVGASDLNTQVRDNFNYLFASRPQASMSFQNASDYSTSSTSFVDVDATVNHAAISATLSGSRAIVLATFMMTVVTGGSVGSYAQILSVDLSTAGAVMGASAGEVQPITLFGLWTGLSAGSRSWKIQFRTNSGTNAAKIVQTAPGWAINMIVWEI